MRNIKIISIALISLYFLYYISTYTEWHFIDSVNLIFHEAGHTIFFFTGNLLRILAGSAFQILLPLSIAIYFYINKSKISSSLCLLWVGQNILNVSIYIRDSILMKLDLLGGDSVIHDWNYILTHLNILKYTYSIANTFYFIGIITILLGIYFSIISLNSETE